MWTVGEATFRNVGAAVRLHQSARGQGTRIAILMKIRALITMMSAAATAAALTSVANAQARSPRFLYVYRDSVKSGVDSAYRAVENDGAQICADFQCPNPYVAGALAAIARRKERMIGLPLQGFGVFRADAARGGS